jgi:hypothetical protein
MIKGIILPDHVQINKFSLSVPGLIPLTFLTISGLEEELDNTDLPDRTNRSGGRKKPIEWEATHPLHHVAERLALETWYEMNVDPVVPGGVQAVTLRLFSQSRLIMPSFLLMDTWPFKRAIPDLDLDNDGEIAASTWGFKSSEIIPLT